MGLIIFICLVPVLAVLVAGYVFLREPLPPFHITQIEYEEKPLEIVESWPFPRAPKP